MGSIRKIFRTLPYRAQECDLWRNGAFRSYRVRLFLL
jgi:hypothetical protein